MLPSGWFLAFDQAEIAALQQKCLQKLRGLQQNCRSDSSKLFVSACSIPVERILPASWLSPECAFSSTTMQYGNTHLPFGHFYLAIEVFWLWGWRFSVGKGPPFEPEMKLRGLCIFMSLSSPNWCGGTGIHPWVRDGAWLLSKYKQVICKGSALQGSTLSLLLPSHPLAS